jgi:Ca2+-transporting ATPase
MVFAGTTVAYGHGRVLVTGTGMSTQLGRIAGPLQEAKSEPTPLQRALDQTGKRLGAGVIVVAAIVVITILASHGVARPGAVVDALLFGVALAVAAVPEGLAAIVTVVLAIGVQRMARRGAIVRKLPAVQTLASPTVIASDKTGTLTRNEMTVRVLVTAYGEAEVTGTGYIPQGKVCKNGVATDKAHWTEINRLLEGAALSNNAVLVNRDDTWSIIGDPTEAALLVAAKKATLEKLELERSFPRVREIPFSSSRKMMSTLHLNEEEFDGYLLWTKGAPDVLLERCYWELNGGKPHPLSNARRADLQNVNAELANNGFRTIGVGYRLISPQLDWQHCEADELERQLIFVGILGITDPPRVEVAAAVSTAKRAGIRPIMITGDHPGTARTIAQELGILTGGLVVTGAELESMDVRDLQPVAMRASVYAQSKSRT